MCRQWITYRRTLAAASECICHRCCYKIQKHSTESHSESSLMQIVKRFASSTIYSWRLNSPDAGQPLQKQHTIQCMVLEKLCTLQCVLCTHTRFVNCALDGIQPQLRICLPIFGQVEFKKFISSTKYNYSPLQGAFKCAALSSTTQQAGPFKSGCNSLEHLQSMVSMIFGLIKC